MIETILRCDICKDKIPHEKAEYQLIKYRQKTFDLCKRCYMLMVGSVREIAQEQNPGIIFELDDTMKRI